MTKPHVLQMGAYPEWDQAPLDAAYVMHRYDAAIDKAAFLANVGPEIRAIATNGGTGVPTSVIKACPKLELISIYGVGYDAVDLAECKARGIRVTNTPDVLTEDCADLAVGMLLVLARGMVKAEDWARSGEWVKAAFPLQRRVTGMKVGILGLGRIGLEIAKRLEGFSADIAYSARSIKDVPYAFVPDPVALAARSEALIVSTLANAETRHIVNAQVLAALGPTGLLINISRAANIDEDALLDALEARRLAGAALDVFEGEPRINPRFLALPNVVLQPHHASGTVETRKAMGQMMRDNLTAHFAGRPLLSPVN
ncbi:2-hydroxyacid dehydrogenase [bacterium]|nr:2-hydroxyacid dehydrogenase [bacterium]